MFRRHPLLSTLTFVYLGVVGLVTLGPRPLDEQGNAALWRVLHLFADHESTNWITYTRVEFGSNILMFLPVGVFFLLLFGRGLWFVGLLAGVALTCGIETAQLFIPGRVSTVSDVIANSIGTLIGVLAALVVTGPAALRIRRARRQGAAAAR